MRKDAKIALLVILALMVLVVIIWGRSPRPDDDLALQPPPQRVTPKPAVTTQAAPSQEALASSPDLARRDAQAPSPGPAPQPGPAGQPAPAPGDSTLTPPEPAMINHVLQGTPAVVDHTGAPPDDSRTALPGSPTPSGTDRTGPLAPARPGAKPQPLATHTVAPGDNYYKLAQKYYHDRNKWKIISDANNIPPQGLRVGQTLTIPPLPTADKAPAPAAPAQPVRADQAAPAPAPGAPPATPKPAVAPPAAARTYTVKRGDTFASIAREVYHDSSKWQRLYSQNRAKLPKPAKPDCLKPGMVIDVPDLASAH